MCGKSRRLPWSITLHFVFFFGVLHTEETLLLRLLKHLCLGKRETGVRHDDLLCQLQDVQTLLEIGGLFEVALREREKKRYFTREPWQRGRRGPP